jgi:hypothetical protein
MEKGTPSGNRDHGTDSRAARSIGQPGPEGPADEEPRSDDHGLRRPAAHARRCWSGPAKVRITSLNVVSGR